MTRPEFIGPDKTGREYWPLGPALPWYADPAPFLGERWEEDMCLGCRHSLAQSHHMDAGLCSAQFMAPDGETILNCRCSGGFGPLRILLADEYFTRLGVAPVGTAPDPWQDPLYARAYAAAGILRRSA